MNRNKLKTYAPQARRDFIAAVTDRAAFYGLTAEKIEPVVEEGDVAVIGDTAFPRDVANKRQKIEERINRAGFEQVMEAMAYTWFNRLAAIRYMELHGYLEHGYRVLSHPEKQAAFEILDHCTEVELPGVDRNQVVEFKLDGSKDEELYRLLLLGQCHALHQSMPFLFEAIEDETELLLPDNLTKTDSLIRHLVNDIPEDDWQQIEIIGWLYQFYISEKKDQVIGKVVKSEDIPAATQLFTPNWIVKYMIQNSLGAQWLATYPHSPLKDQMEYYIEPAEQTDEVKAQLADLTPSTLNPEELTLIDPASGSGHILVEAYELFKAIYLERGYRQRDVAQLILEKNLFGLDIDQRAAQLTGFALMMKGRADDRRLFERNVQLTVMALVDSAGFDAEGLAKGVELADYGLQPGDLTELKRLFEQATTFGSLIQVPEDLATKLPALKQLSEATSQDLFVSDALKRLGPLVQQAELLAAQYDAVVANPPYMGRGGMNAPLKKFAKDHFPDAKSDLFTCFIERGFSLTKGSGHNAMVTMQSWMFLSSFEKMRERMLREKTIRTMAHLGARAFGSISGEVVQTTACISRNQRPQGYKPAFFRLLGGGEDEKRTALINGEMRYDSTSQDEFERIPGSPVAYWVSERMRENFERFESLGEQADVRQGLATSDNKRFVREWHEVSLAKIGFGHGSCDEAAASDRKWFPFNKGGAFRKWAGNYQLVVNWERNGSEIKRSITEKYPYLNGNPDFVAKNPTYYFREGLSWSALSSGAFSLRHQPLGFIFADKGQAMFPHRAESLWSCLALMNSVVVGSALNALSPTLDFNVGYVKKIPARLDISLGGAADRLVSVGTGDWNAYERSWDFQSLPILTACSEPTPTLESSYTAWITQNRDTIAAMKRLEEENNRLFIDAYGLADELTPDVPIEQITLTVNPAYRYGGKLSIDEQWTRFRQDTMEELISYAIGSMMGRYSLDKPGLIYAHSRNEGFDPSQYPAYPADEDGIVPITDFAWFADDASNRFEKFIATAWPKSHLEENLKFVAESLGQKRDKSPRDNIRHYLARGFLKHHLQMYKKRPIYWLFSSGKQRAFQCLVYLHRYNEGTLARMRTEYVIPLQGKIFSRIEQLDGDIAAATSTSHRKKLEKERDTLVKQRSEIQEFDEKLRHYADQRISLDLDDGVKVNYAKFGDLLAEVKAVTGKNPKLETVTA